ncbi:MAG: hypothetical protein JKY98_03595 [Gammaproteobacteria bacterium]|nr:hypothetical protein [Gammaproteobacteria bacterium]
MTQSLLILIGTTLANNLILIQFPGATSVFRGFDRLQNATVLALFSAVVMVTSAIFNFILNHFVLIPLALEYLQPWLFVLISALLSWLLFNQISQHFPRRYHRQRLPLYMVASSSAVIGICLPGIRLSMAFFETLAYALAAACAFTLLQILFAALRERVGTADVPLPFQGLPLEVISAGIVAMALMAFTGAV